MRFTLKSIMAGIIALVLTSCATSKKLTLMQDIVPGESFTVPEAPELKIIPGDELAISISSKDPELALPFNSDEGMITVASNGSAEAAARKKVYPVDQNGEIEFPVFGKIMVGGKTLLEVKDYLIDELRRCSLISDPVVSVDMHNFKVTMLGEVAHKGNMSISGNNINLLQAFAQAGDFTTAANLKEVLVIRTVQGTRTVYAVNMYSKNLYNSPAFYLQQNDVIYVKPRGSKVDSGTDLSLRLTSIGLSLVSTISTLMFWITRAK
ncbi:MAG: polysaccharide biosynthesis/export family protein [Bacteroidales bacterium]|nr:polysaccharide biosynthesis/export family protein [Bacteroidales bacterium]